MDVAFIENVNTGDQNTINNAQMLVKGDNKPNPALLISI